MDELFSDENIIESNEMESFDCSNSGVNGLKRCSTTTIEKVISPIRKPMDSHFNYQNIDPFDYDLSFNKSKTTRKYPSLKKSYEFSPVMRSTPKPSKVRKSRKKCNRNRMSISLWDKAIHKNPELGEWIDTFNEDMKKVESTELSVTQSSLSFSDQTLP